MKLIRFLIVLALMPFIIFVGIFIVAATMLVNGLAKLWESI
jgi:hypothetical protein